MAFKILKPLSTEKIKTRVESMRVFLDRYTVDIYGQKLDKDMIMEYYKKHGLYTGVYKTSVKMNIIDESKIDCEEEDEAAGVVVEDE